MSTMMRLAMAILLTQTLIVSSFNINREEIPEMTQPRSGRVKRLWWNSSGSGIGGYFYGKYGGGKNNNYGGTNIGSINVKNINISIG